MASVYNVLKIVTFLCRKGGLSIRTLRMCRVAGPQIALFQQRESQVGEQPWVTFRD